MKAIILEKTGGVENFKIKEIDRPTIKENEVLVEVKAIGINPVDFKVRKNKVALNNIYGAIQPVILGWDIAGIVVSVGDKAEQFEMGDDVFGMVNFVGAGKAYAEFVAAPETHLAKMPEGASFEEAAATTLAALTALQALQNRVKKDDKVLIHAGSGGVGHYAIQIAKSMGAYVITTSSAKNKDFVMSLGADEHIDYRTQAFEEVLSDIDFVVDGLGGEVTLKSIKVLKAGGTIVTLTSAPDFIKEAHREAALKNVKITPLLVQSNGEDMNTLKDMLDNKTLIAHVSKTFRLEDMGKAHLELESGRTVGKIVVNLSY